MASRLAVLGLLVAAAGCARVEKPATVASHAALPAAPPPAAAPIAYPVAQVTFAGQIQPILARCTPCHFPGGKMYDKLPFDRAETVRLLGEKLFTRIHDESERQLIRDFLAQKTGPAP